MTGRVVVLGSSGVIGRAVLNALGQDDQTGQGPVAISSRNIDLSSSGAADELADVLIPGDSVVFLSALTPDRGRGTETLLTNLRMADAVGRVLRARAPAHLIYMSSDAVYPFGDGLVSEASPAAPADLYGVMHRTREIIMESLGLDATLAILRCTLVLSPDDTHNSYGPNRFRRQAESDGKIVLGGAGEEMRDHVLANDVGRLVGEVVRQRFAGVLNIASGESHSFHDVALMVADSMRSRPEIVSTDRTLPVTHRHFDTTSLRRAFPSFRFTPLRDAIAEVHRNLGLLV